MKTALALLSFALLCAFQDPPAAPDFAGELKALKAEYRKAQQEYGKLFRETKTSEERKQLKNPGGPYLDKLKDLAERAKGTDTAPAALIEIFQVAPSVPKRMADGKQALDTLVASHMESPLMEGVANSLRYGDRTFGEETVRATLEAIRDKSPHAKAKGAAIFTLSVQDMERDEAAARAGFNRLKKDFAETPYGA